MSGGAAGPRRTVAVALALMGALALVVGALFRPAGGLRGAYAIRDAAGREMLVHERVDPALDFTVHQKIDSAYIFHWSLERHGFPASMPPYVIRWRGLIHAARPGTYGFALEAQGDATLAVRGALVPLVPDVVAEVDLPSGWHPIAVDYALAQGDARLVLLWKPPGGRLVPVPAAALSPGPAPDAGGARRAAGWGVIVACLAAWAALQRAGRRGHGTAARVVADLRAGRRRLALGTILILAAFLRFDQYAIVPFHHETADEYQHAWEGWNLLRHGVPASWTTFPDRYPVEQTDDFRWFGDRYVVARPYFDHPPLFSVLVGLVNSFASAPSRLEPRYSYLAATLPVMRLVPIVLSLVGLVLLHRLALAYGASERGALLAALVYATLPVIVLAHRLVKAENLVALFFMGAILAVHREVRAARGWRPDRGALLAGVLCGLAIWTKATAIAVAAVVVVLLLARGRARAALWVAAITAAFGGLYLAYAWAYDFGIFLKVLQAQGTTKWVGIDGLLDLLGGKVVVKWFGRGWYLWLLLAAGVAAFQKERALLLPIAVYAVILALTADQRVIYGWYRIPLYPFLCVAAGLYLDAMVRESDLPRVFPFAATAVATGIVYAFGTEARGAADGALRAATVAFPQTRQAVALFALLALVPFVLRAAWDRPWSAALARAATIALVIVFLATSVVAVARMPEIYAAARGLQ